jgi:hypothetical protein
MKGVRPLIQLIDDLENLNAGLSALEGVVFEMNTISQMRYEEAIGTLLNPGPGPTAEGKHQQPQEQRTGRDNRLRSSRCPRHVFFNIFDSLKQSTVGEPNGFPLFFQYS